MAGGSEIERKFLLAGLPATLVHSKREPMRQGYIALDGDTEVRVRISPHGATLTIKRGRGQVRIEQELPLQRGQADALWELTEGRRVEKTRRRARLHTLIEVEIDAFSGALDGLVMAEVEFGDENAAMDFRPPAWLGREVTGDDAFSNRNLAIDGLPDGA